MYRGTVKTYTGQRARIEIDPDAQRSCKRRRIAESGAEPRHSLHDYANKPAPPKANRASCPSSDTVPSSPTTALPALVSSDPADDGESELSSVPSSPPAQPDFPMKTKHIPAFTFMKRINTRGDSLGSMPLSEMTPNSCRLPGHRETKKAKTQMQIDLGGMVRKTCRACGMEYMPSVKEDSALHKEFCGMNTNGIEMGKAFVRDPTLRRIPYENTTGTATESIVVVDRKSSATLKRKVKKVLDVVNAELSAADISEDSLWELKSPMSVGSTSSGRRKSHNHHHTDVRDDRFKAFIYLVGDRCIGFCLTEKINQAFRVVDPTCGESDEDNNISASKSSSISYLRSAELALLGIARIWVSTAFRGRGVARDLLHSAQNNFFYGLQIPQTLIAFSQPTESGGQLATSWFGTETGWHVYNGDC